MLWAKQSTAFTVTVGPVLDSTGAEYASLAVTDLKIRKHDGSEAALNASATLTYTSNGRYTLVGTTSDSGTLGRCQIACDKSTYQMPLREFMVLPATTYDALATNAAGGLNGLPLSKASNIVDANVISVGPTGANTAQTAGDIYLYLTTNLGALGANLSAIPKTGFKLASDGLAAVTAWTVAITGNITGNLSGSIGSYTGNTPQTGDAYARLGAPAGASTAADIAAVNSKTTNLPAAPASTTNITAGTITTVTNLTNLPSIPANWLTAAGIAASALNGKGDWSTLTQANVRTAIGLGSANLDTQLAAILAAASAAGGSGAHVVTITVNDGTTAIQNALVNLVINASVYSAMTNASGIATLTPNEGDGTYSVRIAAAGYQFTPTTLVVAGDTSHTYSMSSNGVTPSTGSQTTGYLTVVDSAGNAKAGVVVTLQITRFHAGDTGLGISTPIATAISDSSGLVQFPGLPQQAYYTVKVNGADIGSEGTLSAASTTPLLNTLGKVST